MLENQKIAFDFFSQQGQFNFHIDSGRCTQAEIKASIPSFFRLIAD
jgi:hypothetical protein